MVCIGICSLIVTIFYIPQLKEAMGFDIMQFLGSEIGSERKAVNIWYPISLLLAISALALSFFRKSESFVSIGFFSVVLIAVVHFPPFSLWMLGVILDISYLPGMLMFLLHSTTLILAIILCLQLLRHGKKMRIDE